MGVFLEKSFPYTIIPHSPCTESMGSVRSYLNTLLSSDVGVQETLHWTAGVGGPFCNLLGLLVARMEVEDFTKAIEVTRVHVPDPADVEVNLFLRDVYDFFVNNRPILSSIQGLQESVHRSVVELTEARAALARQRPARRIVRRVGGAGAGAGDHFAIYGRWVDLNSLVFILWALTTLEHHPDCNDKTQQAPETARRPGLKQPIRLADVVANFQILGVSISTSSMQASGVLRYRRGVRRW